MDTVSGKYLVYDDLGPTSAICLVRDWYGANPFITDMVYTRHIAYVGPKSSYTRYIPDTAVYTWHTPDIYHKAFIDVGIYLVYTRHIIPDKMQYLV